MVFAGRRNRFKKLPEQFLSFNVRRRCDVVYFAGFDMYSYPDVAHIGSLVPRVRLLLEGISDPGFPRGRGIEIWPETDGWAAGQFINDKWV